MNRILKDAELIKTKALPAANANANCDSIELGAGFPAGVQVQLTVPALPALADAKTVTYTFQQSDDNATWVAIPELATVVSTGAGGAGCAAVDHRVSLPPSVKKYLNVNAAVLLGGGDNTAKSFTLALVF